MFEIQDWEFFFFNAAIAPSTSPFLFLVSIYRRKYFWFISHKKYNKEMVNYFILSLFSFFLFFLFFFFLVTVVSVTLTGVWKIKTSLGLTMWDLTFDKQQSGLLLC